MPYDLRRKKLLKLISISDPLLKCNKNNPFFQRTLREKKNCLEQKRYQEKQSWFASKGDAVYLVELDRHCALQCSSSKSDVEFRQIIGQSEAYGLPSGQCQISHLSCWMSCYTYYTHFILHPQITTCFNPYKIHFMGRTYSLEASKNLLGKFITQKNVMFWEDGIMKLLQR